MVEQRIVGEVRGGHAFRNRGLRDLPIAPALEGRLAASTRSNKSYGVFALSAPVQGFRDAHAPSWRHEEGPADSSCRVSQRRGFEVQSCLERCAVARAAAGVATLRGKSMSVQEPDLQRRLRSRPAFLA